VYGKALDDLEKLAKHVVRDMYDGKRIGWVGGARAQALSADTTAISESVGSEPGPQARGEALHSVINRLEQSMEQDAQDALKAQDAQANKPMKVAEKLRF
jgi:hypothetical protein